MVSPCASGASISPDTMVPRLVTRKSTTPVPPTLPRHCHRLAGRDELVAGDDVAKVGVDVVEAGGLLPVTGRADAIFGDEDVVAEKIGVVDGGADADVGYDTGHDDLLHTPLAQPQIEVGAKEAAVAPLGDP